MFTLRRIFMALPLLLLVGCAATPDDIHGFNIISIDEERQLGDKFALEVAKEFTVVPDPEVQGYVDRLGRRLLTGAREVQFPYTFTVVKDDSVNAFAIPGGHVYVHTGLIKAAQSENELAGVMAHEINHVVARHGTRQLTQRYGYNLVLELVLGQDQNMVVKMATELFGKAGTMAYSRSMERQADYLGVETMYRSGYDPNGMLTFFSKLDAMRQRTPGQLEQFFSSHPLTAERIANVQSAMAALPPKSFPIVDNSQFKRIQGRL
ncbi:MAG TPA: M48 family metallopeptidase [Geobacterales bacterium]|nr:M48 family metallopeptidase [Geobacterales bacterium]